MSRPSLFILTTGFLIFSALYAAGVAATFDYSTAKLSDFDGIWVGVVECSKSPDKNPRVRVEIRDGVGYLANFGDEGSVVSADLNPDNGKIKWSGHFMVPLATRPKQPFKLKGQWMDEKFSVKGRRSVRSCKGMLQKE